MLLGATLFLPTIPAQAAHRFPLLHRTETMQGSVTEPAKAPLNDVWKFTLLGLAGLSFLIRKRL
jgi:hypothetical protein